MNTYTILLRRTVDCSDETVAYGRCRDALESGATGAQFRSKNLSIDTPCCSRNRYKIYAIQANADRALYISKSLAKILGTFCEQRCPPSFSASLLAVSWNREAKRLNLTFPAPKLLETVEYFE